MSKRFTDSEKWKKPFIRGLNGAYKFLWLYILDNCDHAGIWNVEIDVAQLRINEGEIYREKAEELFKEKIIVFDGGTKWFIPSFIEFQYGELSEENRVHKSIIIILKRYKLFKLLKRPFQGAKDKDKDKDMDKDKDKEKDLKVRELFDYWNKQKIVVHGEEMFKECRELLKIALNGNGIELLKQAIENYGEMYHSEYQYCDYAWSLKNFLKRDRGYMEFVNKGEKWVSYTKWFNKKEAKKEWANSKR